MPAGITELKLFLERSRYVADGGRVGSCPWSLLELRSRILKLNVEVRLSKGPSRRLYERFR